VRKVAVLLDLARAITLLDSGDAHGLERTGAFAAVGFEDRLSDTVIGCLRLNRANLKTPELSDLGRDGERNKEAEIEADAAH
jgi:hypothetical protein